MNVTLSKALFALLPSSLLLFGSAVLFARRKTLYPFMQLIGAACIVAVALTHVCEALHLIPGMQWELQYSAGHYLDLTCAVLGLVLFPAGYFLDAVSTK